MFLKLHINDHKNNRAKKNKEEPDSTQNLNIICLLLNILFLKKTQKKQKQNTLYLALVVEHPVDINS